MSDQDYFAVNMPVTQPGPYGHITDGLGSPVTRQVGLPPDQVPVTDPVVLPAIIQPDAETKVTRNLGSGPQFYAGATLYADRPADGTIYVDGDLADLMAPGLARTNLPGPPPSSFGDMPVAQQREAIKAQAEAMGFVVSDAPTTGVVASDQPGDAHDPRDPHSKPQVLNASALPVVKKRAIVPVVLPTPETRRVKAKAAPKGKK